MVFFRTAIADWSYVPSGSMEPTLYDGDYVLIDKISYGPSIPFTNFRLIQFGQPQRGDVITFYPPHKEQQFVKRVIGVPGDVIRIEQLSVFVNGEQLAMKFQTQHQGKWLGEEAIQHRKHLLQFSRPAMKGLKEPIKVPEGKYFVMGDHRNNSEDSRFWGFVDEDKIIGKVSYIALSFSEQRPISSRVAIKVN